MTKKRILIVDDEDNILISMKRMLDDQYTIFTASDGAAALELIKQEKSQFDLIFCDLSMPKMNGAALYLAIVDQYKELEDRFIFMTGGPFGGFIEEFGLTKKSPCMDKPFKKDELNKIIINFFADH